MAEQEIVLQSEAALREKSDMARKKLLTVGLIFFGLALTKYRWKCDEDCPENAGAYVAFEGDKLDKLVAGTIFLNAKMIRRTDFTFVNMCWYLLHELMHVISGHGSRRAAREAILWNFATDHVIECFLRTIYEDQKRANKKFPICTYGGIEKANIIDDLHKAHPNATAEEAYDWIVKNRNQFAVSKPGCSCGVGNKKGKGGGGGGNSSGQSSDGDGGDDQQECTCGQGDGGSGDKWVEITDKKTGKKYVVHNPQMTGKEKKAERMAQAEHRAQFEQAKQKG